MARRSVVGVLIGGIVAISLPTLVTAGEDPRNAATSDVPRSAPERVLVELYAQAGLSNVAENAPRLLEQDQTIDLTSSLTSDMPDFEVSTDMSQDWLFVLTDVGVSPDNDDSPSLSAPASDGHQLPLVSLGLVTLTVPGR